MFKNNLTILPDSNTLTSKSITIRRNNMQVTSKGQVTIPQNIREKYGITPLSEVDFIEEKGRVYLAKSSKNYKSQSRIGKIRGIARINLSTDEIMQLTRGEK
jgi:AbrB family looped-hinge helix DNA binding protein